MNQERALHVFATAIVREILRVSEDELPIISDVALPQEPAPGTPTPRFDFDESADTCEHNGMLFDRNLCPVHGPEGTAPAPTAEELDDLTRETFEEENPMIARARRLAAQKKRQEGQERVYAEELPMSGAGPPPEIPPNPAA